MSNTFDATAYRGGYQEAASLIDTYGVQYVRNMTPSPTRTKDWHIGFLTCVGVALERVMKSDVQ